jgi:cytochrome c oxidase cbb3-type subunit 2
MVAPRSVVPQSIMPNYPWLLETDLDYSDVADRMRALRATGVPYSLTQAEYDANVKKFGPAVADQLDINKAQDNLLKQARDKDFDGIPGKITEMEALVAYLQVLGTMVDFTKYDEGYFATFR